MTPSIGRGTRSSHCAPLRRDGAWGLTSGGGVGDAVVPPAPAWPLFYDGDRRTRFAYAIYALNKARAGGAACPKWPDAGCAAWAAWCDYRPLQGVIGNHVWCF